MKKIHAKVKNNGKVLTLVIGAIGLMAMYKGATALSDGGSGLLYLALGILLILVAFYRPMTDIDREGVDDIFSVFGVKKHTVWKWKEISRIVADFDRAKPDVVIAVQKPQGAKKSFNVLPEDVQQIFEWAAMANDRILIQHNGDIDIDIPGRTKMNREEYEAMQSGNAKPQNFHQFANEARKIKEEKEQIVAEARRKKMLKKATFKRNEKKLKSWR
ncbi:MAG: hypothetical protein Q4D99_03080 [Bacillota bacterium]|nr:hypothetical protein [Bacillota bacterium]